MSDHEDEAKARRKKCPACGYPAGCTCADECLLMIAEAVAELDERGTKVGDVPPMMYPEWIVRVVRQREDAIRKAVTG